MIQISLKPIGAFLVLVVLSSVAFGQNLPAPKPDTLDMKVMVSAFKPINLEQALDEIKRRAEVSINTEVLSEKGSSIPLMSNIAVTTGTYTIRQLLERYRTALPGLSWSAEGKTINIICRLDRDIVNPMDAPVSSQTKGKYGAWMLLIWLGDTPSKFRLNYDGPIDIDSPYYTAEVDISPKMSLRQALNQFAERAHITWYMNMYKRSREGTELANSKSPYADISIVFSPTRRGQPFPAEQFLVESNETLKGRDVKFLLETLGKIQRYRGYVEIKGTPIVETTGRLYRRRRELKTTPEQLRALKDKIEAVLAGSGDRRSVTLLWNMTQDEDPDVAGVAYANYRVLLKEFYNQDIPPPPEH